ncbi:MAG: signal peptidase I [Bryobacteraceae bacterium]
MATPPETEPVRNFISEWTVTILLLLFGTSTLLQAFVVPTGSMENTVLIGDHLIVDKLAYAPPGRFSKYLLPYTQVKRGDVIVFRYPLDISQNYVKRAIGIPGDRIHIVDKQVFVNGKPEVEPYKLLMQDQSSSYLNNFPQVNPDIQIYPRGLEMLRDNVVQGDLVVPPGFYFAMGDNRDNSADSRFWGLVPRENIIGKPVFIFWSYDAPTEQLADGNINLDHILDLAQHFFTKTRWDRTFRRVLPYPLN